MDCEPPVERQTPWNWRPEGKRIWQYALVGQRSYVATRSSFQNARLCRTCAVLESDTPGKGSAPFSIVAQTVQTSIYALGVDVQMRPVFQPQFIGPLCALVEFHPFAFRALRAHSIVELVFAFHSD